MSVVCVTSFYSSFGKRKEQDSIEANTGFHVGNSYIYILSIFLADYFFFAARAIQVEYKIIVRGNIVEYRSLYSSQSESCHIIF